MPPASPIVALFIQLVVAVARAAGATNVRLSDWFRTPAENAAVGGAPQSLHLLGLAVDLVGEADQLARMRLIWSAIGLDAIDEGDHTHLELDG